MLLGEEGGVGGAIGRSMAMRMGTGEAERVLVKVFGKGREMGVECDGEGRADLWEWFIAGVRPGLSIISGSWDHIAVCVQV